MADCIDILESIGQGCEKENQVGGVNRRVWVTQKSQVVSTTTDANGYVNTITMGVDNAIIACDFIQCDTIIGMHYDTFEKIKINKLEAQNKFKLSGNNLILLNIGETKLISN